MDIISNQPVYSTFNASDIFTRSYITTGNSACFLQSPDTVVPLPFVPMALSDGYYLPTNFKSLYSQQTDVDQLVVRKQTFIFWPTWAPATLDLEEMAQTGLYYTGDGDEVKCFNCSVSLKGWKEGDDPKLIHRKKSPHCQLVRENKDVVLSEDDEDYVDFCAPIISTTTSTTNIGPNCNKSGKSPSLNDSAELNSCDNNDAINDENGLFNGVSNGECLINHNPNESESDDKDSTSACFNDRLLNCKDIRSETKSTTDISQEEENGVKRIDGSDIKHILSGLNKNAKQKLREENKRLRNAMICHKCKQEKSQVLFLPCRHLVACEQCAEEMDDCILCKQRILGTVRIFMV